MCQENYYISWSASGGPLWVVVGPLRLSRKCNGPRMTRNPAPRRCAREKSVNSLKQGLSTITLDTLGGDSVEHLALQSMCAMGRPANRRADARGDGFMVSKDARVRQAWPAFASRRTCVGPGVLAFFMLASHLVCGQRCVLRKLSRRLTSSARPGRW
jgi:hypothetical protein